MSSDFQSTKPPVINGLDINDPVVEGDAKPLTMTVMAPAQYLIHQSGTDRPERIVATNDTDAREVVTRRVRAARGNTTIFLYKLVGVERYVPSSEYFDASELKIEAGQFQFPEKERTP